MRKKFKKADGIIMVLAVFLLAFTFFIKGERVKVKDKWYKEKIQAASLMNECMKEIKEEKLRRNIKIDKKYDINSTGLIGVEMSKITTTSGALEAKRTSTNPNFAAVIVHMMKKAGLKEGDEIGVNFSSSFPALNIAVLSACEVLKVNPIVISSIGASTWGANIPEFNYMDMEELLYRKKILSNKSTAISIGGAEDIGKDMEPKVVEEILKRARNYGRIIIHQEDLQQNIKERYSIYTGDNRNIKAFINVGGNIVSLGETEDSADIPPGLIRTDKYKVNSKSGLIQMFLQKDIPVIHILNIKKLASDYGVGIDPMPLPKVGQGEIYYAYEYPFGIISLVLGITIITIIIYGSKVRSKYD
ncbi:poly-gamma-glutamate system protein [Clostridium lundense]|uniref:poly-gamma-glutamate system protein n=1 Tax=Clostridium lundense TaxID=319475 RepID=UPI00048222FF|nr:poly-gamma-glutamate system protein [Clostridium lundense]